MYINHDPEINKAIEKLGQDFPGLNWDFHPEPGSSELVSHWLGGIMMPSARNTIIALPSGKAAVISASRTADMLQSVNPMRNASSLAFS